MTEQKLIKMDLTQTMKEIFEEHNDPKKREQKEKEKRREERRKQKEKDLRL